MFIFDKQQRLCSHKRIETLFKTGKSFLVFPFSVRYLVSQGEGKISVLVVCPKRYQKLAVNRNRIKRLIRESYRLNSLELKAFTKEKQINIDFSMSYVNKQMSDFHCVQSKVQEILEKLQNNISSSLETDI
ncbi:MAG: ribonuclease P protein component [Bacteroidales bacterium]|nr:ribonuclease P protein component [Bacteroidales bacterium]